MGRSLGPYLKNKQVCMTDATCYESYVRFPTDMKLLWERVEWLYRHICRQCGMLGMRRPRSQYEDVSRTYLAYSKKRKRKSSRSRMLKRRLLHLSEKLFSQTYQLQKNYKPNLKYTDDYCRRLCVIEKVLGQEKLLFQGDKVSSRIVSVSKHYLRPIVRGKETRSVEFGAKVNNIQIDGISLSSICLLKLLMKALA